MLTAPLLARLDYPFEAALLTELEEVAQLRIVETGTVLMEPGQPIRYVSIVLEGSIKIMRPKMQGSYCFIT